MSKLKDERRSRNISTVLQSLEIALQIGADLLENCRKVLQDVSERNVRPEV